MATMTMTKEQLKTYRSIKLERDRLLDMITELEAQMRCPRAQKLDGMPRGGTAPSNPVETIVVKHTDLLDKYRENVAALTEAATEIEKAIEVLDHRERTLIRLHYIQGLTWEEVCISMNYSWRQVHRIHAKALEILKNA